MTASIVTENIDSLRARRLREPGGWEIAFRSENEGMHHQLYLNGRLRDWTDTPGQRRFLLGRTAGPFELFIAAVAAQYRAVDLSAQLPAAAQQPGCVYRVRMRRSHGYRRHWRLDVLTDHGAGELDPQPVARREIWPEWLARWGWGEESFGLGGFGYDGYNALGFGTTPFGNGPFGIETGEVAFDAIIAEEAVHQITLRTTSTDGRFTDSDPVCFKAAVPPAPPAGLAASDYDTQTNTLTLQIQ